MVTYKTSKDFEETQLKELFASVGWMSAAYPKRLVKALASSDTVISAWDGSRLVGLVNAIDDGELTAYAHYLLVHPQYQAKGVGTALTRMLKETYKDFLYLVLTAETKELVSFYERHGFHALEGVPMALIRK
ncbi:MAG: GNAT family N-acetyltransferase [Eubacterium sp.]|nr:GNAT family N-acetyltransferase [Eubacterium sp.]